MTEERIVTTVTIGGREIPAQKVICPTCRTMWLDTDFEVSSTPWVATCPKGHVWSVHPDVDDDPAVVDALPDPTDPTAWFDQFPPLAEGAEWNSPQWCPRHWAPCPTLGANGVGAAAEVVQIWLDERKPEGLGPKDYDALNAAIAADSPICCTLGDARMYEIWGRWGPEEARRPVDGP